MERTEMETARARLVRLLWDQEHQAATVERARGVAGEMPSTRLLLAENATALRWALHLVDAALEDALRQEMQTRVDAALHALQPELLSAKARVYQIPDGGDTVHLVVWYPEGATEPVGWSTCECADRLAGDCRHWQAWQAATFTTRLVYNDPVTGPQVIVGAPHAE